MTQHMENNETRVKTGEDVQESGKYREEGTGEEKELNEGDTAPAGKNGPATWKKAP